MVPWGIVNNQDIDLEDIACWSWGSFQEAKVSSTSFLTQQWGWIVHLQLFQTTVGIVDLVVLHILQMNSRPFEVKETFIGHNRTNWREVINSAISLRLYLINSHSKNLGTLGWLCIESVFCYRLILGSDSWFFSSCLNSISSQCLNFWCF